MLYDIFRFDYVGYQKLIKPIIASIDVGDYNPLYDQAKSVVKQFDGNWILEDKGTMLETVEVQEKPSNIEMGYWLLVLLSSFLYPAMPALEKPAPISIGLQEIGWGLDEIDMLVFGESTAKLIKPDFDGLTDRLLSESDPYWQWIRPTQANRSGWLSFECLTRMKGKLLASEKLLNELNPSCFSDSNFSNTTRENIMVAYSKTLTLLTSVTMAKEGLYVIYS